MSRWNFCIWCLILGCKFSVFALAWSGDMTAPKNLSSIKLEELKNDELPPCQLCKTVVDSFKNILHKTARNYEYHGKATVWEEDKKLLYARREQQFIDVFQSVCSDVDKGHSQCQMAARLVEQHLKEWWETHTKFDLYSWLCIEMVKQCCPENHYGPNCLPCPKNHGLVCSGNGKCKGNGTRKGNGECSCDQGYSGHFCGECASEYYEAYRDNTKILCSKCHTACQGNCTRAGPKGCLGCNIGWFFSADRGCLDVNECVSDTDPCTKKEFCINNEGSYTCLACDRACDGCTGDGPDMCDKCARGFVMKNNLCTELRGWDEKGIEATRYLTYCGLSVATCIIFQKNPIVASFIGLLVAMYIMFSEYMLDTVLMSDIYSFITAV